MKRWYKKINCHSKPMAYSQQVEKTDSDSMNQLSNTKHNKGWAGQEPYFIPSVLTSTAITKILQNKKPGFGVPQCKKVICHPVISNSSVLLNWTNWALVAVAFHIARRGSSKPPVNQEGTRWQATAWLVKILFLEEFLSILPNMPWLMSMQSLGRRVEEGEGNGEDQNCHHVK